MLTSHHYSYPCVRAADFTAYFSFSHAGIATQKQRELGSNISPAGSLHGLNLICLGVLLGDAQTRCICNTEDLITGNERGKRKESSVSIYIEVKPTESPYGGVNRSCGFHSQASFKFWMCMI
ncbi:hypothetical protein EPR50_G00027760 [Xyrichtys novacula]|uniref:Uncharacterized protein n=1 Tax=Xyrichtys novacula TaxID=13765 RepID=A0AAV1FYE5_XYRNO|nr:hypothetical protein EPR50_G00027760 [Xyrichtys novacula]